MSDSVDRVFVHALNTVKKIPRTGSARPPSSDRLRLYGLYKQSMEGDVAGVMARPDGDTDGEKGEREKWDAWSAQHGLSRNEAKRRYISTLISTMHTYASATPEARELVAELEFVWDQIKANETSSGSELSQPRPERDKETQARQAVEYVDVEMPQSKGRGLRVLRPFSEPDEEKEGVGSESDGDYDDARDMQLLPYDSQPPYTQSDYDVRNRKWRRRMEQALVKMTAEVAALREQIEARRLWGMGKGRRRGLWNWLVWFVWAAVRHVIIDAVVVGCVVLWKRGFVQREVEEVWRVVGEGVRKLRTLGRWRRRKG